jgi:hypothetical protein
MAHPHHAAMNRLHRAVLSAALPPRRGAASLVVVMVLFFIITLVAAYTSRNLLFEQRTSANQYRSTLAFETADAGVEWALARLNEGRMNNDCTPITAVGSVGSPPQPSFRERYLGIDPLTGAITSTGRIAGCVFNGTNWVCDCPATGNPNPTVTYTGNGPFAAFWVRFVNVVSATAGVTSVVRMQVNACTRVDATCLDFAREAQPGDGLSTVWALVALRSAMGSAPAGALTVRGPFSRTGGSPTVTNSESTSGGITIHGAQAIATAGITLRTIDGTPPQLSVSPNDAQLAYGNLTLTPTGNPANVGENRMFNSFFGMWPTTYFAPPGVATVDCASDCNATDVNNQVLLNPGRAIRLLDGGTPGRRFRIGADVATAAAPVIVIADPGVNVEFDSGTFTFNGVIYSRATNWELRGGNGTIRGAAIAEQGFDFSNNDPFITYDRDVLLRVRNLNGSFVKVPGGWRDLQP